MIVTQKQNIKYLAHKIKQSMRSEMKVVNYQSFTEFQISLFAVRYIPLTVFISLINCLLTTLQVFLRYISDLFILNKCKKLKTLKIIIKAEKITAFNKLLPICYVSFTLFTHLLQHLANYSVLWSFFEC